MRDNVILSSFLAALTAAGSMHEQESLSFEGEDMTLQFTREGELASLTIEKTKLYFFYVQMDDYYIAAGFPAKNFDYQTSKEVVDELLDSIKEFIEEGYKETRWEIVDNEEFVMFENKLLMDAVYPWMRKYKSSHSCMLGKNCVLRLSIVEGERKSIVEMLREGVENFRRKSMFTKMRMMMGGMVEKMRSI